MEFYKQRYPISQHPNFLGVHYPTKFYLGYDIAHVALVCEQLDEDITTLREWMRPQAGYLHACQPEAKVIKLCNVMVQTLAILNMLQRSQSIHGCICPDLILVANKGKTLKLIDSFILNPILGQFPGKFYGGNMAYWSKSQGKLFDKLYKFYQIKGNQGVYGKIYDTNKPAHDDENFRYSKVGELGNVGKNCDVIAVCLIWIEIILGDKFWLRGDQPSIIPRLQEYETSIRSSDKYSHFKMYRIFLADIIAIVTPVIKSEDSVDLKQFSSQILKLIQKYFPQERFLLWEPYFDATKNEVRILNNIAACFYVCKDMKLSREFYNMGMKLNAISLESDPVIIYNNCLIESEIAGCEEESGLVPLHSLQESPERNCLIFALQLKQAEFFSNSFYLNRRFNASFFRNQTLATVLHRAYEYLKTEKDNFECKKRCIFNQYMDNLGNVLQKMVNYNFIVCLVTDKNNLYLVVWKIKNYCHFRCKRIRFLLRDPLITSNIVAHRKDDSVFIIFGIENKCIVYKYVEDLMEINKLKISDLLSNILRIESDRTSHQVHIILENREIWKFDTETLEFVMVTSTERNVEQVQINNRFFCVLYDNRSLVIRNLESKKKMENVNATKIKVIQLIDTMNILVILNYRNEMLAVELNSNKIIQKKQLSNSITNMISSKYHPLVIAYGHQGFIQIVQIVDGEVITTLGPFKSISICYYDEPHEILSVIEENNNVKIFRLSLKQIGRKKQPDKVFRPIVMHTFDNKELAPSATVEQIRQYKDELTHIVQEFMKSREVKHLITLEKNFEELKAKINICDHYDFLLMMRKVNQLKYKNGVKDIGFNMVYEEFSYCQKIENKFDNLIACSNVSSKQRFMAIASRGGPLLVYSLATMQLIHKFEDNLDSDVVDICFTPDEKLVIKAAETGEILSWDLQKGNPIHKLKLKGTDAIVGLSCSDDSRLLAISRDDSTIEFFDLVSCRPAKRILKVYFNMINYFVFLDNYKGLTYGIDHNIRRWDIDTGVRRGVVVGHSNKVIGASKLTDKQIISCGIDKSVRLWDVDKNFVCFRTFTIIEDEPLSFDLSPDKRLLLTAEEYNTIRIYDLSSLKKVWQYTETEEVKKVRWILTAGTIYIETVSNVKVLHLFLDFGNY